MGTADDYSYRLLAELGARFDAVVAREEDEAANDLALSLDQDRSLVEVLTRSREPVATPASGVRWPVRRVGPDHVEVDRGGRTALVRLDAAVLEVEDGTPSADEPEPPTTAGAEGPAGGAPLEERLIRADPQLPVGPPLLEVLRTWSRRGAAVEVEIAGRHVCGRLARARRDHLVVRTGRRTLLLPLASVSTICLAEDSHA